MCKKQTIKNHHKYYDGLRDSNSKFSDIIEIFFEINLKK